MVHKKHEYDAKYAQENYFHYRQWLYAPYISSLVSFSRLKPGALILDVGCGQGLFSHLFNRCGMRVHGIDASEVGIRMATTLYAQEGITFEVADIDTAVFPTQFDCIFVRSCSLYNTDDFAVRDEVTGKLLKHLKEGGVFIFAYYTVFSERVSPEWRYHSLNDVERHFRKYPNGKLFFCNKIDTLMIRRLAFNPVVTRVNMWLSRVCGIGGDAIYVLRSGRRAVPQQV